MLLVVREEKVFTLNTEEVSDASVDGNEVDGRGRGRGGGGGGRRDESLLGVLDTSPAAKDDILGKGAARGRGVAIADFRRSGRIWESFPISLSQS